MDRRNVTAEPRPHPYFCGTRYANTSTPDSLAFNAAGEGNIVGRWAPSSTVSYSVCDKELTEVQVEAVKVAMSIAAENWALSGLNITFSEAVKEEDATLLVIYDPYFDEDTFASAFFPGARRRIIDIGPRLFRQAKHMSNVLTHELGHVLGLRHELWDSCSPPERSQPFHWPSNDRDKTSIMNSLNACNLPLLVLSEQDCCIIQDFYNLPAGDHTDFFIKDYNPTPVGDGIQRKVTEDGIQDKVDRDAAVELMDRIAMPFVKLWLVIRLAV